MGLEGNAHNWGDCEKRSIRINRPKTEREVWAMHSIEQLNPIVQIAAGKHGDARVLGVLGVLGAVIFCICPLSSSS